MSGFAHLYLLIKPQMKPPKQETNVLLQSSYQRYAITTTEVSGAPPSLGPSAATYGVWGKNGVGDCFGSSQESVLDKKRQVQW